MFLVHCKRIFLCVNVHFSVVDAFYLCKVQPPRSTKKRSTVFIIFSYPSAQQDGDVFEPVLFINFLRVDATDSEIQSWCKQL